VGITYRNQGECVSSRIRNYCDGKRGTELRDCVRGEIAYCQGLF
jgi:hypothetical protein